MNASENCISLIREFEGCRLTPYDDIAGKQTIGIGHLIQPGEHFEEITEQEANELLQKDLQWTESAVNDAVEVDISQNQFDALVSFTFNLGGKRLLMSTLLERLNNKEYQKAADEFLKWDKASGVEVSGLKRRRIAERKLFLEPVGEVG